MKNVEMVDKQENDVDQELNMMPTNVKPQTIIPAQAPVWSWQVPQVPTYTSGGSTIPPTQEKA